MALDTERRERNAAVGCILKVCVARSYLEVLCLKEEKLSEVIVK